MTHASGTMKALGAAALFAFVGAACDSPIAPDAHDEADGFLIVVEGETIYTHHGTGEPQPLVLEQGTALAVQIVFLDDDGHALELDHSYHADLEIGTPPLVTWALDPLNPFGGTLTAVTSGTSSIRVAQMHGTHADYRSPAIPLSVVTPVN
jgi:hypothetical protein